MAKQTKLEKELYAKHMHGQKKYGPFSFVKDGKKMTQEVKSELIDAINYMLYLDIAKNNSKKELLSTSVKDWNAYFQMRLSEVQGYSNRSENKVYKTIAKLRDLYESL